MFFTADCDESVTLISYTLMLTSPIGLYLFSLILFHCRKNDAYDDKAPEEVLGDRVKRVGGQDAYDADLDPNTYL